MRDFIKSLNSAFAKGHRQVKIDDLTSKDVVIGVMGPTGSGKSSFIEFVSGMKGIAGHTLESCTTDISVIKVSIPEILDSDICLVDTPGFDDTHKSDVEIFRMISDWLNDTYKRDIPLAGLLYFHRISDNRMAGTPLKNLTLFERLCGKEFSTIVLTTTMWDEVEEDIGEQREEELKDIYWNAMIARGSTVRRFQHTHASAFEVLRPILARANERHALLLQKEMTELGMKLKETAAGRALAVQLEDLVPKQQRLLAAIRIDLMDSRLSPEQLANLQKEYQQISSKLQTVMKDVEKMKISVGERFLYIVKFTNWKGVLSMFRSKKGKQSRQASVAILDTTKFDTKILDENPADDSERGDTSLDKHHSVPHDGRSNHAGQYSHDLYDEQSSDHKTVDSVVEDINHHQITSNIEITQQPPSNTKRGPVEFLVNSSICETTEKGSRSATNKGPVDFLVDDSIITKPTKKGSRSATNKGPVDFLVDDSIITKPTKKGSRSFTNQGSVELLVDSVDAETTQEPHSDTKRGHVDSVTTSSAANLAKINSIYTTGTRALNTPSLAVLRSTPTDDRIGPEVSYGKQSNGITPVTPYRLEERPERKKDSSRGSSVHSTSVLPTNQAVRTTNDNQSNKSKALSPPEDEKLTNDLQNSSGTQEVDVGGAIDAEKFSNSAEQANNKISGNSKPLNLTTYDSRMHRDRPAQIIPRVVGIEQKARLDLKKSGEFRTRVGHNGEYQRNRGWNVDSEKDDRSAVTSQRSIFVNDLR